jgi:Mrp family chromosome partitioning ATPase/capsular polysaccharide biosynthesis protein
MVDTLNNDAAPDARGAALQASLPTSHHAPASSPTTLSSAGGSSDFVRVIRRALRGRYLLALGLALLAGGVGMGVGWFLAGPLYRSDGMVRIASALPVVIQQTDQNQPIPMFDSFMQAQQELVTSRFVLEKVVADPIWNTKAVGGRRPTISALAADLKVEVRPRSENVRISYTDPVAAVASSIVESTIAAYQTVFEQDDQQIEKQRLQLLEEYRNTLTSQLDLGKTATAPKNSTPSAQAQVQLPPSPPPPPSPELLAMTDGVLRRLIDDRERAGDQLEQAAIDFGPNHSYVVHLTLAYERASERVQGYMNEYAALHVEVENRAASPVAAATEAPTTPAPLSASMQQMQNNLDDVNRRVEILKTEAAMPKRFEVVSLGNFPVSVPGRQMKWTAVGGGLGSGLLAGIMVLTGLYRRRYNFCADVIESLAEKMPFVAAVPNLDLTRKSRRWVDGAQCVHRLRQRLDQNASTYLVSSADWSEGRTSLAMSLAISLCGAGARTVVVDADLVTRGLTRALGLENCSGFFEMLQESEVAAMLNIPRNRIAVIPAGAADEPDGLSISAPAVARLLTRLKASFDVVLIDAGAALGRVETCVLAAQVDGVLLTVGRGTEQALLVKALDELQLAGAKILGAVFNRAKPRDFDRSVQRRRPGVEATWLRRPIAGPLANLGPLVQSVAMSLKRDVELLPITGDSSLGNLKGAA